MGVWTVFVIGLLLLSSRNDVAAREAAFAPPLRRQVGASGKPSPLPREVHAAIPPTWMLVLALSRAQMAIGRVGDALEVLTPRSRKARRSPAGARARPRTARHPQFEVAVKEFPKPAKPCPRVVRARHLRMPPGSRNPCGARPSPSAPDPGVFAYLADWRTGPSAMPETHGAVRAVRILQLHQVRARRKQAQDAAAR